MSEKGESFEETILKKEALQSSSDGKYLHE